MADSSEKTPEAQEGLEGGEDSPEAEDKIAAELAGLAEQEDEEAEDESALLDAALGEAVDEQESNLSLLDESADPGQFEDPVREVERGCCSI